MCLSGQAHGQTLVGVNPSPLEPEVRPRPRERGLRDGVSRSLESLKRMTAAPERAAV